MRLFFYYALHSFKNQLKKLFKTWVLIFILICVVLGGGIGAGIALLTDGDDSSEPDDAAVIVESVPLTEKLGVETADIIEAAACAVSFVIVFLLVMNADRSGSGIFLPADVRLLFPSPLPPQSVLMFRLMTQLGVLLLSMLYLLFQLPNLVLNAGLSVPAALALLLAFVLCFMFGKLLQVLFYLLCSSRQWMKKNFHRLLYAVPALVLVGYLLFMRRSGDGYLRAAILYLNAPAARFIPLFGWIKGFCGAAVRGGTVVSLLFLLLCFAAMAVLLFLIRRTKADFYEDAMQKSEETAAKLEAMQAEKSTGIVKRKKDRSGKLRRDGLSRGSGANVFFYKALYNRFRFARFGFLTKTTEAYLAASLGVCLLCRFAIHTESLLPPVLTLAGIAFYRSLGNPLEKDTGMSFFALIPDSCFKKLFFSLLGGCADCCLDLLPALILAGLLQGGQVLSALVWLPFILSVDIYATAVGAFINLSVPVSAGKTVKQFVQILFIYFGLLPDAAILAVGIHMGFTAPAALAAALLNFLLGLLFLGITPSVLIPGERAARESFDGSAPVSAARKTFSRCGFAVLLVLVVGSLLQLLALYILNAADIPVSGLTFWLVNFLPLFLIAYPAAFLLLRKGKTEPAAAERFGVGRFLALIPISLFLMYAGNLIGTLVTSLFGSLGAASVDPVDTLLSVTNDPLMLLVFAVLLGPVFEELMFRRLLLNRMRVHGEKTALVLSALLFGLFHGNLSQFFYAFLLGLLLGYVFLRSGKVILTILLHVVVNFFGSIVPMLALSGFDENIAALAQSMDIEAILSSGALPELLKAGGFLLFVGVMFLLGLILFLVRLKQVHFLPASEELPKGRRFSAAILNPGMLLAIASCLILTLSSFLVV